MSVGPVNSGRGLDRKEGSGGSASSVTSSPGGSSRASSSTSSSEVGSHHESGKSLFNRVFCAPGYWGTRGVTPLFVAGMTSLLCGLVGAVALVATGSKDFVVLAEYIGAFGVFGGALLLLLSCVIGFSGLGIQRCREGSAV